MSTALQNGQFEGTPEDISSIVAAPLSVVIIGPDSGRRGDVTRALKAVGARQIRELKDYPELDQISQVVEIPADILMVDLDAGPEFALEIVESLCATSTATVMVYTRDSDTEMMIRCMRAGAREFLTLPISQSDLSEVMVRASARLASRGGKKAEGLLSAFWGAKGGSGVTTLATSFAVSNAQDLKRNTLLIDFDLPLGDVALQLGITPQYSTVDALANHARLDANFLSRVVMKHSSGLSVLSAPGKFAPLNYSVEAVNKLLQVARQQYDSVIVDTGSRMELLGTTLFEGDTTLYLVSQVGIAELRNSNRFISEFFQANSTRLQVILNRFSNSMLGVDEEHITKALTMRAQWRVAEDTAAARKMHDTGTPLVLHDALIARSVRQMARTGAGMADEPAPKKKKLIGFF